MTWPKHSQNVMLELSPTWSTVHIFQICLSFLPFYLSSSFVMSTRSWDVRHYLLRRVKQSLQHDHRHHYTSSVCTHFRYTSQSGSVNKYHQSRKTRAWLCPTTFNSMQVSFWQKNWTCFTCFMVIKICIVFATCWSFRLGSSNVQGVGLKRKYKHNVFARLWL